MSHLNADTLLSLKRGDRRIDFSFQTIKHFRLGVAELDQNLGRTGHDIAGARFKNNMAQVPYA